TTGHPDSVDAARILDRLSPQTHGAFGATTRFRAAIVALRTCADSVEASHLATEYSRLFPHWCKGCFGHVCNPAVRIESCNGKDRLVLSPLDKLDEPPSLSALRAAIAARLPRVDLPDLLLEIAERTHFAKAFTHVSEGTAQVKGLTLSLCAVL